MGKNTAIRIFSGLVARFIHICRSKHRTVICKDIAPHGIIGKFGQSRIVGIIDKIFAFKLHKINDPARHTDKECQKYIGDDRIFLIACRRPPLILCLSRCLHLTRLLVLCPSCTCLCFISALLFLLIVEI